MSKELLKQCRDIIDAYSDGHHCILEHIDEELRKPNAEPNANPSGQQEQNICQHKNREVGWDEVTCMDCGWIHPGGPIKGPNKGWFPSKDACREFEKYGTYPGMQEIKPTNNRF